MSERIKLKRAIRIMYAKNYFKFKKILESLAVEGKVVEIGSGQGFIKELIPEAITTDIVSQKGIDLVFNCTNMPFDNGSVKAFFLLNAFHHIDDVETFLREAGRCLAPKGKILIIDQHLGFISSIVLKYFHSEGFDTRTESWKFKSNDPLLSANGALAWIVFKRDQKIFEEKFKTTFKINRYIPHTPLMYWAAGGLKSWNLTFGPIYYVTILFDNLLMRISRNFGSFVDIEIEKI